MRCKEVRKLALDGGAEALQPSASRHLADCAACASYARDLAEIRRGFAALARSEAPLPSWGFSDRVLRRCESAARIAAPDFLESAGRRVIVAALVLVFTLLLAMIVPSSGPVRHELTMESYWSQNEAVTATAASYPVDWTNSFPPAPVLVIPAADHGGR